tara:strand:- start:975 stop:1643 length:669 start_codon:yes stop_codon:yes gene_type:complete
LEAIITEIENSLDSGLLLFAIFSASSLCSLMLTITNKNKSLLFWIVKWFITALLFPHKFIGNDILQSIPFDSPIETSIPIVLVIFLFLSYDLISGTKRGKKVSKKFKIIPKLFPIEEIKEKEQVDGTTRQVTKEIIDNEHEILEELVGNLSPSNLDELEEGYGEKLSKIDENMPLANQNFPELGGRIDSAEEDQEYCGNCNEPVKNEWKACPLCGEFLEVYE